MSFRGWPGREAPTENPGSSWQHKYPESWSIFVINLESKSTIAFPKLDNVTFLPCPLAICPLNIPCCYIEILYVSVEPAGLIHFSWVPRNSFIDTRPYTTPCPFHVTQRALTLSSMCLQVSSHAELPASSFVLSVLTRLFLANESTWRMKPGTDLLRSLRFPTPALRSLPGNRSHASVIDHFCYVLKIKFVIWTWLQVEFWVPCGGQIALIGHCFPPTFVLD